MKILFQLGLCILLIACDQPIKENIDQGLEPTNDADILQGYDSTYAKKLGADDYGMKPYVMAFLKDGPNQDFDSLEILQLQEGHMANINELAEEGKLVLAGPFYGNPESDLAGIYIFNVSTIAEAEVLTKTDPAVEAGNLIMELHLWYGSAALMEVNQIHERIAKENP